MQTNGKPEIDGAVIVYATFPSMAAAEAAGKALVEEQLAACVNILPGMVSIYRWQGAIERSDEVVMIVKAPSDRADGLVRRVRELHTYDNPAVLVLPVAGGSAEFLTWIGAQCA